MSDAWIVEPRDTLIVRDSRPISDGVPMRSVAFPWPSSIAGLARTRAGSDEAGRFVCPDPERLKDIEVAGPWLVELDPEGGVKQAFVPAPADCLWDPSEDDGSRLERRRLVPGSLAEGEMTDLPGDLRPVFAEDAPERKPAKDAPAFWSWAEMSAWLCAPQAKSLHSKADFGLPALLREVRTHVAVGAETGTAVDGQLFSTEGLRFYTDKGRNRLALAFRCGDDQVKAGGVHLGGERRLSRLTRASAGAELSRPEGLSGCRTLRLVLITPGIFEAGWRPKDMKGAELVAAAVGRPEVVSGWDFVARGPKKCRRMAPAGSVYWYELADGVDADAWIDEHWMKCVSDDAQDRRDGFGLCVVGVG